MLAQTYNALHIGADRLVAMGTRAVLEMAIVKTCGDHRSFKANVAEFVRQGFMNAKLKDTILEALDFGSAAIQRIQARARGNFRCVWNCRISSLRYIRSPRRGREIEANDSQAEWLTRQSASCEEGLLSRPPSTADREFLAALVVHRQGEVDEGDVRAVDVLAVISGDRRASVGGR